MGVLRLTDEYIIHKTGADVKCFFGLRYGTNNFLFSHNKLTRTAEKSLPPAQRFGTYRRYITGISLIPPTSVKGPLPRGITGTFIFLHRAASSRPASQEFGSPTVSTVSVMSP